MPRRGIEGRPSEVEGFAHPPQAVLLDRDGTIVVDVPYNGDPARVQPVANARASLDRLRAAGLPIAIVSNQSGIGRGYLSAAQVEAVNHRIEELLGPFDAWLYCPHAPRDECECRKPKPKMLLDAARALGVAIESCVVVGDGQSDEDAARSAGAMFLRAGGNHSLTGAVDVILRALR